MPPSLSPHDRIVNSSARSARHWWQAGHTFWLLLLCAGANGCAHTQRNLIYEKVVSLPTGRFTGPVELEVPRRAENSLRDFEIRAELTAACGPLLRLSYPDGEVRSVGDGNKRWQELLARRAEDSAASVSPGESAAEGAGATESAPEGAAPTESAAEGEGATESAAEAEIDVGGPGSTAPAATVPAPGHWQRVTTETWPGQLEFLARRDGRCGKRKRYTRKYTTAYDETGRVTIWAEVPQELADAELSVRVYEIVDVDRERRAKRRAEKQRRKRERELEIRAEPIPRQPIQRKPRPPRPELKVEHPQPAEVEGATWSPGQWAWSSRGKWVWVGGEWRAPAQRPAARFEDTSSPPVAGCRWQAGHWVWVAGPGRWDWKPGHWNAPPPRVESPGQPPVPESPWIDGRWIATRGSFKWNAGYWGRPRLRVETPPPPPYRGARWRTGAWLQIKGKWIWSPGFYEQSTKPPPRRRAESPGKAPQAGAVWLAGFWRWEASRSDYRWVAGHWEIPPGADYMWIADPPDPQIGYSTGGHWKLIIDVPVEVRP